MNYKLQFVAVFVFMSLLIGAVAQAQNASVLQQAIDQKSKELDEVTKKIQETQIILTEEAVRGKTLKQEVSRIDTTVQKVNLGIRSSELTIDKLRLEIQRVQGDISDKEQSAELRRATITQLLQDYQLRDRENMLISLLNGKSLAEGVADLQRISDLNDGLLREIDELRSLKQELADRLEEVSGKKNKVEQERLSLEAKRIAAQEQLSERQRLLAETKNREDNYKKILTELEKQQQAIGDEIDSIEDVLRAQFGSTELPKKRPGVFLTPIEGARMSQAYGATKFAQKAYKSKFHNGVDYGVPIGTPVMAADGGVVLMAGNNGRVQYGRYIVIKHANGLTTLYAHLSKQSVKTGETVERGQIIGYSGNTGYSTGPHLHFTVYLSSSVKLQAIGGAGVIPVGYTINPEDYL